VILVCGSINIDLVCRVPKPGETVLTSGYQQLFGGKGANQAVAGRQGAW
jgi:ribokinase